MNLRRGLAIGARLVFAIVLAIVLVPAIAILRIFLWIVDIPNKIGKRIGVNGIIRKILYSIVDQDDLEFFRDEFMDVLHPKIEYPENYERWGLEREIDLHRERAIDDLRKGRQVIALFGGITALLVGYGFGLALGALAISVTVILSTLIVAFRVIVVDKLAYSSTQHRSASIRELAKMKSWNEGPLRGQSGVGVVITCIIASRDGMGQELGFEFMDIISDKYIEYDTDKW